MENRLFCRGEFLEKKILPFEENLPKVASNDRNFIFWRLKHDKIACNLALFDSFDVFTFATVYISTRGQTARTTAASANAYKHGFQSALRFWAPASPQTHTRGVGRIQLIQENLMDTFLFTKKRYAFDCQNVHIFTNIWFTLKNMVVKLILFCFVLLCPSHVEHFCRVFKCAFFYLKRDLGGLKVALIMEWVGLVWVG